MQTHVVHVVMKREVHGMVTTPYREVGRFECPSQICQCSPSAGYEFWGEGEAREYGAGQEANHDKRT